MLAQRPIGAQSALAQRPITYAQCPISALSAPNQSAIVSHSMPTQCPRSALSAPNQRVRVLTLNPKPERSLPAQCPKSAQSAPTQCPRVYIVQYSVDCTTVLLYCCTTVLLNYSVGWVRGHRDVGWVRGSGCIRKGSGRFGLSPVQISPGCTLEQQIQGARSAPARGGGLAFGSDPKPKTTNPKPQTLNHKP